MKFNNPYLDTDSKLDLLAKWIIVHSVIYYELNDNIVSDKQFDDNCKQFMELKRSGSKSYKWYYVMRDFDGSTGFHLYSKMGLKHRQEVMAIADWLIKNKIEKEN